MRRWRPILPGENEDRQLWHRFPAEIISHAVWLYHVFSLNLHDVELILAEHGIAVYPVGDRVRAGRGGVDRRHWCLKSGSDFAGGCADDSRSQEKLAPR